MEAIQAAEEVAEDAGVLEEQVDAVDDLPAADESVSQIQPSPS